MRQKTALIATTALFALGCATAYHPLTIPTNRCDSAPACIRIQEQSWGENTRCDKHARKNGLLTYRVSITNNSDEVISFSQNDIRLSGAKAFLSTEEAYAMSKMLVWPYIFWLPVNLYVTSGGGASAPTTQTYPIGIPIGIGNMMYAANSNNNLLKDLKEKSLASTQIKPGESKAGLIYLKAPVSDGMQLFITCTGATSNQKFELKGNF